VGEGVEGEHWKLPVKPLWTMPKKKPQKNRISIAITQNNGNDA